MARAVTGEKTFIERARRQQIVTATIDVLYENGFAAASIGAIAERIGVSKGVLTYHFTGKGELLREVTDGVLTEASAYMRARIGTASSSLEALRIYVTSNLEYFDANRRKIIALREIVNGMPPGGTEPAPYEDGNQQAVAGLAHLLEAGQASGEFGEFSAQVAAVSMRASIDALATLLRTDPAMDIGEYGAQLLRLYERAVRA